MVYDDILPLQVPVQVYDMAYRYGIGDDELPPYVQRVAGSEPVCRIDGFGRDAIQPGDPPDRFHRPDLMINGPGAAKIAEALFDHFGGYGRLGRGWRVCRRRGSCRVGWDHNCPFAA